MATCIGCGRVLRNDTHGARCEDCFADSPYHPKLSGHWDNEHANRVKLGKASSDRRRVHPHGIDAAVCERRF